jgi:hypothetical protein
MKVVLGLEVVVNDLIDAVGRGWVSRSIKRLIDFHHVIQSTDLLVEK